MTLQNYAIIDSTLREGEQFVRAFFTTEQKVRLARLLDAFGVEYLELTSPCASPQSFKDCGVITCLGLRAKILTHIRCCLADAETAVATGVDGVNVLFGISPYLRRFSHGKSVEAVIASAREVISFLQKHRLEVRFSAEDSLRSDPADLFRLYEAVDALGVDRVGVADTVGIGTPQQVYHLVAELRRRVRADIEFHGHDDSGCAIANSYAALEAGATHLDTTVLGIGERNGITPLGGLMARLYTRDPLLVARYNLPLLAGLDQVVAEFIGVPIPFNNYVTGFAAFSHKAGIHTNAVLNNPSTYEALRPEDFGLTRHIHVAHRLTGHNAVRNRAQQLGITLNDAQIRQVTEQVKTLSDEKALTMDDVDRLLRTCQENGTRLLTGKRGFIHQEKR
jgi:homocitrate synthase